AQTQLETKKKEEAKKAKELEKAKTEVAKTQKQIEEITKLIQEKQNYVEKLKNAKEILTKAQATQKQAQEKEKQAQAKYNKEKQELDKLQEKLDKLEGKYERALKAYLESQKRQEENKNKEEKDTEVKAQLKNKEITVDFKEKIGEGYELRTEIIEDKKLTDQVKEKLATNDIKIYDLSIYKEGQETKLNGQRTVKIVITEYADKEVKVYHLKDSGDLEELASKNNQGEITFQTNHFSKFVIAAQEKMKQAEKTNKKEETNKEEKTTNKEKQKADKKAQTKAKKLTKTGLENTSSIGIGLFMLVGTILLARRQQK
ncbi:hypothetical protein KMP12_07405, partial [Gemella sp. zg-1178]|nr:hypothetical protein [Gemella sp. zg-1178]